MSEALESPKSVAAVRDPLSLSEKINEEVEAAAGRFRSFQGKLHVLIGALKEHNASIVEVSEKRLRAAKQLELLMAETPMSKVTGEVEKAPISSPKAQGDKDPKAEAANKSPRQSPRLKMRKSKNPAKEAPKPEILNKDEIATAFESVAVEGEEKTLSAVNESAHKLANRYAEQHMQRIIKYAEDWEKVISSKVQGRMNEFNKLKESLSHYEKKVKELRAKKTGEKVDRNENKLGGARESHEAYGEGLLLLLDEVTERAWKDMYPLLTMALNFHTSYATDQAEVFSNLKEAATALEEIGTEHELDLGGRLKSLKECRPEEIFTGDRQAVLPFMKAQAD